MQTCFSFAVTADLQNLPAIHHFVKETAAALGVDPAVVTDLRLAVEEVVANIMMHGYQDEGGAVAIEMEAAADKLLIRLRDRGVPFDPTTVAAPDLTSPLAGRNLGGMGVYLTQQLMDEVTYRVTAGGENELTLIKQGVFDSSKETSWANAHQR